jgi:predicted Zn-dependent peptidase
MVGVGSRHEDLANSGISHFVEHMVFKGGSRYPTARDVSEAIEGVGGVLNAATDREATVFWTRVPSAKLGIAVSVLSDMLLSPALDTGEVVKERQVVIEELRMYQDNPQDYVQILFDEVMWPDHPLGWDVAGREETVSEFTAEDCREHLAKHLLPSTLVVSVSGGRQSRARPPPLRKPPPRRQAPRSGSSDAAPSRRTSWSASALRRTTTRTGTSPTSST